MSSRIARAATAAVAWAALAMPFPAAAASDPVVYAHRGGAAVAPENTLGAFQAAHAAWGAKGVWLEMDVQLAADGALVVIHDATLDRTTSCTGRVVDHTSAALQACDASKGWPAWGFEPVPRLADVLTEAVAGGWRLLIELKNIPGEPNFDPSGTAAADALVAALRGSGIAPERVGVQSFFPTSLDRVEAVAPEYATALLTLGQAHGSAPGAGFPAASNAAYASARGYEISAPDVRSADLAAGVAAAQALGRTVVVWTADSAAAIGAARAAGADGIITNVPGAVYAALEAS